MSLKLPSPHLLQHPPVAMEGSLEFNDPQSRTDQFMMGPVLPLPDHYITRAVCCLADNLPLSIARAHKAIEAYHKSKTILMLSVADNGRSSSNGTTSSTQRGANLARYCTSISVFTPRDSVPLLKFYISVFTPRDLVHLLKF